MILRGIAKSYWAAKNRTQIAKIMSIARKYDALITIVLFKRKKGVYTAEEAEYLIEELCRCAHQELSEV